MSTVRERPLVVTGPIFPNDNSPAKSGQLILNALSVKNGFFPY